MNNRIALFIASLARDFSIARVPYTNGCSWFFANVEATEIFHLQPPTPEPQKTWKLIFTDSRRHTQMGSNSVSAETAVETNIKTELFIANASFTFDRRKRV